MKNKQKLVTILVFLLAVFLRFKGLATRDIWYDEALDIVQAQKSISSIISDVQTPLHYLFVHFSLYFGKNTFILGFPSVIFGLLSILVIYQIAKRNFGPKVALVVLSLTAVSPMLIEFSQQILHYSYFVFFTLLTLYFYIDILKSLKVKENLTKPIIYFVISTILNILTHPSSLLVLLIETSYFIIYFVVNGNARLYLKKYLSPTLVLLFVLGIAFVNLGGKYQKTLSNFNLDPSKSVEVGYSLEGRLGTKKLSFSPKFFVANFGWYGIGYGYRNFIYLSLALVGVYSLFKSKHSLSVFFVYWLITPFVVLYFFRPDHWFEEKYFIFNIPIYLILISQGIVFLSRKYIFIYVVTIVILFLSVNPNINRTIYGFRRTDHQDYSWNKAIDSLKTFVGPNDLIIVPSGESSFFDFYLDKKLQNLKWIEEREITAMTSEQYQNLVKNRQNIYFASIPDFKDLFLASIANSHYLAKRGGFNIYKLDFIKNISNKLIKNDQGIYQYYDDFRTAKYISDSKLVKNLSSTYYGNYNVSATYGFYNLSPVVAGISQISYSFDISNIYADKLYFYPKVGLCNGSSLKIIQENGLKRSEIYSFISEGDGLYNPEITIPNKFNNGILNLTIELSSETCPSSLGSVSLKSLLLATSKSNRGVTMATNSYQSNLEIIRSNNWIRDSVINSGWDQSLDGVLFNRIGSGENTPLIYKFSLQNISVPNKLKIKSYTFNKNPLTISLSQNNKDWKNIAEVLDNETKINEYDLSNFYNKFSSEIFLKFTCKNGGPTCQVRDFWLDFSQN